MQTVDGSGRVSPGTTRQLGDPFVEHRCEIQKTMDETTIPITAAHYNTRANQRSRIDRPHRPSTVSLTPSTVTYTPTEGQTIPTITCSADCNPACTYSWTKEGQSITTGSGLQLNNIQRGQGGVYRCTASNGHGSDVSVTINVIVNYGPSTSIALSPSDTTYTRTEGDTLPDITCTADCRPGCTFVWTRPDNTNFTVSPVLSLGQLVRSEHGTYMCAAWNVFGESTLRTSVAVQCKYTRLT
ncbi:lachesin-like [Pecten maximus]|uniref:lachesin-like n=1 Tax=Pecten maximus TaxID=6579 RepID=UPI001459125F|nr:lachesin-like [Pecten maximus]